MPTDVPRVLADLDRAFRACDLKWFVFGAQAVAAAGVPRFTADVDVTVAVPRSQLRALLAALRGAFDFREVGDVDSFIAQSRVLPLVHRRTLMPVDAVLAGPGLEDDMLARAQVRRIGQARIPFIEINDLLVLKVLAGRAKDLEDVRAILRAKVPGLDLKAARFRLDELAAMLDDSTLVRTWDDLAKHPPVRKLGRANPPKGTSRSRKRPRRA